MADNEQAEGVPRRVIPLEDLAGRANECGMASQHNQAQVSAQTVLIEHKLAPAIIAASQLIAACIFHCTLAICERLTPQDAPSLLKKIDQKNREGMN